MVMFNRIINFYCCRKCGLTYHSRTILKSNGRCKICGIKNKPFISEVIKKTKEEMTFWDEYNGAILIGSLLGILIILIRAEF